MIWRLKIWKIWFLIGLSRFTTSHVLQSLEWQCERSGVSTKTKGLTNNICSPLDDLTFEKTNIVNAFSGLRSRRKLPNSTQSGGVFEQNGHNFWCLSCDGFKPERKFLLILFDFVQVSTKLRIIDYQSITKNDYFKNFFYYLFISYFMWGTISFKGGVFICKIF